jgi:tetratricopeptide (TPR) repeat protein
MPQLFLFPLRRAPLVRNLVVAAAMALLAWRTVPALATSPLAASLVLGLASLVAGLVIARYGFMVIERSAAGYLDPRRYPSHLEPGSVFRPIKMFLVMVLAPALILFLGAKLLGGFVVALLMVGFALLLPASAMVMTMTDSFVAAIDPTRCIDAARRIGAPYLVLCLFILLLIIGSGQAAQMLLPRSFGLQGVGGAHAAGSQAVLLERMAASAAVGAFVTWFTGNYFLTLICALIGYAMYQYSDALGISVVGPGEARTLGAISAGEHARRTRDALVGRLVAAGEIQEAIGLLSDDLRERPNDLSLHARLHKLLRHEGSRVLVDDHTERYLDLLIKSSNLREALSLVEEAFERNASYEPRTLEHLPVLARAAIEAGKPRLAASLIRGFDRRHPAHPDLPHVYVIGGRLLLLSGNDTARARELLQYVVSRYPQHPAAAEAARWLQRFGANAPATAAPVGPT